MKGHFILYPGEEDEIILPNTVVYQGENALLQMLMQASNSIVASGANFYLGLCGQNLNTQGVLDKTVTLTTLAGEPTSAGGYARQPVARSSGGWPTLTQVNGIWKITSLVVNFGATGVNYSTSVYRMFVASVASGSSGTLFAVSAQLPTPLLIAAGQSFPAQYEFWAN